MFLFSVHGTKKVFNMLTFQTIPDTEKMQEAEKLDNEIGNQIALRRK